MSIDHRIFIAETAISVRFNDCFIRIFANMWESVSYDINRNRLLKIMITHPCAAYFYFV